MLHAFLNEHKVDWSKVIFNNLIHVITFGRTSPGDISKKMGFGFLSKKAKDLDDDQPKPKRRKKEKTSSHIKTKEVPEEQPIPTPPKSTTELPAEKTTQTPSVPSKNPVVVGDSSDDDDNIVLSTLGQKSTGRFRSPVKAKYVPPPSLKLDEKTKEVSSQGEDKAKEASSKGDDKSRTSKKRKDRSSSDENPPKTLHPQEPISAERLSQCSTQEPAVMETEVNHLSLPQEPGLPEETREVMPTRLLLMFFPQKVPSHKNLPLQSRRVYSYKVTNRTLGKDKAPICIELNKPPLDPAFVEEMKELRYALLLSKIKTELERTHQNDPGCNASESKDDEGREIDPEDEQNQEEDADDENDNEDDDEDDDNDDDDNNKGNPNYDSESPLLVTDDPLLEITSSQNSSSKSDGKREASLRPENSSASGMVEASPRIGIPHAEEISNAPIEDLSRAIVPHVDHMDESPIKREDATIREGKMDASPILISSASGGKKDAPPREEPMDTSPTNIEADSPPMSPRRIMHMMMGTVHTSELIHQEYMSLRNKNSQTLEELSKKVDQLMTAQAQSHPPPQAQPQPQPSAQPKRSYKAQLAKELHELQTAVNKVARQQHEIKHSHYSLNSQGES
ncbi:PREDICTED: glutamic acid-rich protein-like [Ipomoea nil]|uniref:glutamic acid-rich protein-like n=1 Tax=Ipomoea nil TaxID=35883 RepID=UPI000901DBB9|nr:PREDICTED: glutamic acid-rich protein-like [Ipomoea nil]